MNLYININWHKPFVLLLDIMLAGPVSCDRSGPMVLIRTDMGDMTVEIYKEQALPEMGQYLREQVVIQEMKVIRPR